MAEQVAGGIFLFFGLSCLAVLIVLFMAFVVALFEKDDRDERDRRNEAEKKQWAEHWAAVAKHDEWVEGRKEIWLTETAYFGPYAPSYERWELEQQK
jgi:hypothetical protein